MRGEERSQIGQREERSRIVDPASTGTGPLASTAPIPSVGVLAIQGDFEAHRRVLEGLGAKVREVRVPADLEELEGLVIPGGESTTMTLGIEREGLAEPLRELIAQGVPVLGTCAGLIMLDRGHLGLVDVTAERNAFGRQVHSFEADLDMDGIGERIRAIFIRAPWVSDRGADVEVLAEVEGHPIAVRQGDILAVSFHPELSGETRLHEWLLRRIAARKAEGAQLSATMSNGGQTK